MHNNTKRLKMNVLKRMIIRKILNNVLIQRGGGRLFYFRKNPEIRLSMRRHKAIKLY